jgi:FlaA1/EpsC-like NDP-sugar epimerase
MTKHRPELIYHAAAYKHVPLMEEQPIEAIRNNVIGTEIVAHAAIDVGAERFVLISTDKAVRPTGIMGMTKRVAELVVGSLAGRGTTFLSVRFANVLGSNGSVLTLFHRQVASGAPLTVTDPDALRYFMMTSEAVELVLLAGALGADGEVYVLNTGEPIRVGDLAENFIRLCGLEPGVDVSIKTTGLRPGERLLEELVGTNETVLAGPHEKVLVTREPSPHPDVFTQDLLELKRWVTDRKVQLAAAKLRVMVGEPVPDAGTSGADRPDASSAHKGAESLLRRD